MVITAYAFRIGREAVLLDEDEWSKIAPMLTDRLRKIKAHRKATGDSISNARMNDRSGQLALDHYQKLTGIELDHPEQLYGLRASLYGSLCPNCTKPFRIPRAKFCAACGFHLPIGQVAGPLEATQ